MDIRPLQLNFEIMKSLNNSTPSMRGFWITDWKAAKAITAHMVACVNIIIMIQEDDDGDDFEENVQMFKFLSQIF